VIYHRPATAFVAAFVGAADFLPGEVTGAGILTELGVFPDAGGRPLAERVRVMIRPDDVTFSARADGNARIVVRSFRGSETVYGLELPSGRHVFSSQPSAAAFVPGLRVRVEVNALHVVVFPDDATGT
jgi:ABC-type Fe3+/spermidine/putrescine transport system ATPase subunit